jgi:hypothetical protein
MHFIFDIDMLTRNQPLQCAFHSYKQTGGEGGGGDTSCTLLKHFEKFGHKNAINKEKKPPRFSHNPKYIYLCFHSRTVNFQKIVDSLGAPWTCHVSTDSIEWIVKEILVTLSNIVSNVEPGMLEI